MEWTSDVIDHVLSMRAGRMSWPAIAQQLDVSRSAVLCAVQRSGRELPAVGTIMPATRVKPTPTCEAVAQETRTDRNVNGGIGRKLTVRDIRTYNFFWGLAPDPSGCTADHHGERCCRMPYKDVELCLGHIVQALMLEYNEGWLSRLAMITESATPRRLAAAIRYRIEVRQLKLIEWSEEVGLPQSTAHKAIHNPDSHPAAFRKIASHFGFDHDPVTGSYRKRRKP